MIFEKYKNLNLFPFREVKTCGETCEEKSLVMIQVLFYTLILKSFKTAVQDFNKVRISF